MTSDRADARDEPDVWPAARIRGQSRSGTSPQALPDPATGQPHAVVGWADVADVEDAVAAAAGARALWAASSPWQRASALRAVARDLRARSAALTELIVRETGKRRIEATGEVEFSAQYFEWFAEAAPMPLGRHLVVGGKRFQVGAQPVGVVVAVTPWNFPLSIPARKAAAALAAGCPVVMKPSELTPLSCLAMCQIVEQHFPPGVAGAVVGDGEVLTSALVDHENVSSVSFTGSTRVGVLVAQRAMQTMTRVTMELGGMAPFIVHPDADLDVAIDALMVAKFRNNGASCIAANNVYVHGALYERFIELARDRVVALRVGAPDDDNTELGPMLRPQHVQRLTGLVEEAAGSGCPVDTAPVPTEGSYCPPSLIETPQNASLWDEELFGPVLPVTRFDDVGQVIEEVNQRNSGLAAYVMGADVQRALDTAGQLRAGIVGINNGAPNTPEVPFGGFGMAGMGREGGVEGMLEFLESQTISIAN